MLKKYFDEDINADYINDQKECLKTFTWEICWLYSLS